MDNRNISLNSNGHGRPEMETSSHAEEKLSLQQMYILYQHTLRTVRFTHQVKPLMILLIHFLKFFSPNGPTQRRLDEWKKPGKYVRMDPHLGGLSVSSVT